MDAAADEELRELRARAYGPHADIAADPAAVRRLQELESARTPVATVVRARPTPEPSPQAPDSGAAGRSDDGEKGDEDGDEDSLWGDEDAAPEASGWSVSTARRRALLWAASIVVTAAIAATITYTLVSIPMISASAQAPQVDTLSMTRTGAVPDGWAGAEPDTAAADFYGLTIFESARWVSESGDRESENRCLTVVRTQDVPEEGEFNGTSWSVDGPMYGACSIGVFPATVEVPIDGDTPDELIERYPAGTALQFVLDGDRVGVFLDSSSD